MAKNHRRGRSKPPEQPIQRGPSWLDDDGFHAFAPGPPPSPEALEEATRFYQQAIRDSPLWDEMVKRFGKEKAEELLLQCRVDVR